MMDKLMLWTNRFQVKSLFLNKWIKKGTKSKPTAANPKSKKESNLKQNINMNKRG
jgi:hypothetical protein